MGEIGWFAVSPNTIFTEHTGRNRTHPVHRTVTVFKPNDPHHHPSRFSPERGVEKWFDPNAKTSALLRMRNTLTWPYRSVSPRGSIWTNWMRS
ncbi:hypothetical protein A8M32_20410 [Sinorhizobium alkalisoli]|uniref:Uncharacterized protein n=1 Tax=Sinorhizobium alkalisoli TaxID=1752398 RepID=A0A1E3V5X0_9HYPH|nr:hypothetical protein A8M32_20410 [Sinorhizobium alkalisoli]